MVTSDSESKVTGFHRLVYYGVLLGTFGLCGALIWPFIPLISWSLILAVIAWPCYRRLEKWSKRPTLAAGLTTALMMIVIVVPTVVIGIRLVYEAKLLVDANKSNQELVVDAKPRPFQAVPALQKVVDWAEKWVDLPPIDLEVTIRNTAAEAARFIGRNGISFVKNAVWVSFEGALMTFTLFFMLRDGPRLRPAIAGYLPLSDDQITRIASTVSDSITASVIGTGMVALAQGLLAGVGYYAVGMPSPILWTVVTLVLCVIPMLGAPVVWVPAAILLAVQGEVAKAVGLALWGLLAVGLVDNVMRPFLVGKKTHTHPLPVLFSVIPTSAVNGVAEVFMSVGSLVLP